ncbi:MAG: hypothetical protein AAF092_05115 [Pseudomonadota bacterium]
MSNNPNVHSGYDMIVKMSRTGQEGGEMVELEIQGDLTINPGKSMNQERYKNAIIAVHNDTGMTAQCTVGIERPQPEGQGLVWQAHDTSTPWYCEMTGKRPGVRGYAGVFLVTVTTENHSKAKTEATMTVDFAAHGDDPTPSLSA